VAESGRLRGAASGLAAAVLFGVTTPVAKRLLPESGPFLLAGLLYLGAGLGLALAAPFRRPGREARLRREDLPRLAGMALAGGVAGPLLLLTGLARLPGAQASLLLNLEAPLTILLAVAAFGESLSARELLGAAAIVLGAAALAGGGLQGAPGLAGALLVAGACAAWALDNNLGQGLSLRDPVAVTRVKALAAGAVNTAVALALGERLPPPAILALALVTGLLGYGLSIVLHLLAMREVGAARQAAYFATAPFVGALAAVPILGERPGLAELLAGVLMAAGAALLVRARHGHAHQHAALTHDHAHVHGARDAHHAHDHPEGVLEGPHSHPHTHPPLVHDHPHLPDAHHRHRHRHRH
jgi:drug/metabolite transporter (DMT)-like permease